MKILSNKYFLLFLIVVLAGILRMYQLGSNPPSLTWDEAAWGYNAYSLGIDGKDEFGKFLPYTYLLSFGDYKPPVYAYLDILPVKIFGMNEFAVRFPSALFGTLTVWLTYFLTAAIFGGERKTRTKKVKTDASNDNNSNAIFEIRNFKLEIPIIATAILAVSPWHIMLSRAAFEANVATFFIVAGMTCFLYWIHNNKTIYLLLSVLSFVLCLYTFNSVRVLAPLLVLLLAAGFWKMLWERKKATIIACIAGILLVLPLVPFLHSPQAALRYQEVNIFSDVSLVKTANQEIANDHNALWSKLLHNRRVEYSIAFLTHYFDNLTPDFLFIKGDGNPKFSTQDVGQMYLWSLPFFVLGVFMLFRKREGYWWLIPVWLLLGIIPAAVARETPHALRIEGTLPTFQILEAYGMLTAFLYFKNNFSRIKSNLLITCCIVLYLLNIGYFLHGYTMHYAWQYSGEWQYGYKDSIAYVKDNQSKYDQIVVSTVLGRPYVYYLFYLQTPPQDFRKTVQIQHDNYGFGFVNVTGFGKYLFADNVNNIKSDKKTLYINDVKNVPQKAKILKTFYQLNGEPVLSAYTL